MPSARLCVKCGKPASVGKEVCDACANIPLTEVRRLAPADPPKLHEGLAPARSNAGPDVSFDDLWKETAPPPKPDLEVRSKPNRWRSALNAAAALLGVAAAAYGVWMYRENLRPDILVPKLAARYLEALRTGDDAAAYALLTDPARRGSALEEFRAASRDLPGAWSGLCLESSDQESMMFGYDLKPSGGPPRRGHVLFTREGARWAVPYDRPLILKSAEAVAKNDEDRALALAQAAAIVNPRDPAAWSVLCQTAYDRGLPADAEVRCARALKLARAYPWELASADLYRLNALLADTYHHALRSPEKALELYTGMLALPGVLPADRCRVLLARSSAYAAIGRPGEALADLDRGSQVCAPADRALIRKMRVALRAPDVQ